jgi:hypothetical protein
MADDDEIPEQIEAVSMAKNSSWEVVTLRGSKFSAIMEHKSSLPCLKKPDTHPP